MVGLATRLVAVGEFAASSLKSAVGCDVVEILGGTGGIGLLACGTCALGVLVGVRLRLRQFALAAPWEQEQQWISMGAKVYIMYNTGLGVMPGVA